LRHSVMDVLMYLFENHTDENESVDVGRQDLRRLLREAGFEETPIDKAMDWLQALAADDEGPDLPQTSDGAIRVFSDEECAKISREGRGLLQHLEQIGVLTVSHRERVIDRLMALESEEIDLEQLRWVVCMVLFNQARQGGDTQWAESLLLEEFRSQLH